METTSQVIDFKQRILREAPAAARRIGDVDKIYYRKTPGYDAWLSASGTVSYREGFGAQPHPTRYGGILAADRALRAAGYKPYNIFTGNEYQMNELRHAAARRDKQRQQAVFTQAELPKISKREISEASLSQPAVIQYPEEDIVPTTNVNIGASMMPQVKKKATYFETLGMLPDALADARGLKRRMNEQIMSDTDFAKMMQKKYSVYQQMERQIGLKTLGTSNKGKGKKKGKKGGAQDEFSF